MYTPLGHNRCQDNSENCQGIHTFREDNMTESATCSPWSRWMKLFLSLRKKIEAFKEEKRDENSPFTPSSIKFTRKEVPAKRYRDRRSMSRKPDIVCFAPSKAKRPTFSWALLPAMKTTATTTMAINTQVATSSLPTNTSCKMCKKWG